MATLVFATNNPNKIREIRAQLGEQYDFRSLADIGCFEEIPETTPTLKGNALQKARHVFDGYGHDCFSEDTGLEVEALAGAPGVITAHYAGPERDAQANMDKVLAELGDASNRKAQFRTVICLIEQGTTHFFEGICPGQITLEKTGDSGFGYDPIFIPEGAARTFAEMSGSEKLQYSHRARAMAKLIAYLQKH
ncbi:MAG: RdgB/HAM1 family non-canonical purine NTP pyrophosphatase [Bacteroidota bacterium]